jgi:hypothetical protein
MQFLVSIYRSYPITNIRFYWCNDSLQCCYDIDFIGNGGQIRRSKDPVDSCEELWHISSNIVEQNEATHNVIRSTAIFKNVKVDNWFLQDGAVHSASFNGHMRTHQQFKWFLWSNVHHPESITTKPAAFALIEVAGTCPQLLFSTSWWLGERHWINCSKDQACSHEKDKLIYGHIVDWF